jgi:hypothetical protein
MNQIAVVNQGGKASAERVIVLPGEEFDTNASSMLAPASHRSNCAQLHAISLISVCWPVIRDVR